MTISVDQILDPITKNLLLPSIFELAIRDEKKEELIRLIAGLHNGSLIDVLAEYGAVDQEKLGFKLYTVVEVFAGVLELIDAPVADVMFRVNQLDGAGGAGFHLLSSFEKYCLSDPARLEEAFRLAKDLYPETNLLHVVLVAGSKVEFDLFQSRVIDLIASDESRLRALAMQALSRFHYDGDVKRAVATLQVVRNGIQHHDESFFSAALTTVFSLAAIDQVVEDECRELVSQILKAPNDFVIRTAAKLLMMERSSTPESIVSVLLIKFRDVNPSDNEAINFISLGLGHLLTVGKVEDVLGLIEFLLSKHSVDLSMSNFEHLIWVLDKPENTILRQRIITRWLLSGKNKLCSSAVQLTSWNQGSNIVLSADMSLLHEIPPHAALLLAMRACGWMFAYPVSAASLMISILDLASDVERNEVEEILFNPLLISYGGSVKKYLESVRVDISLEAKNMIDRLLGRLDSYHCGLQSVSDVKELETPLAQRQAYQRQFNRKMAESFRSAEKDSLMTALMGKPSVILYGNSSIHYVYHGPNGERTRQESPMHSVSTSVEFPSLDNIDSQGLEYMLRAFKVGEVDL